jgi:hypothetical protein
VGEGRVRGIKKALACCISSPQPSPSGEGAVLSAIYRFSDSLNIYQLIARLSIKEIT